jgi:hypothetical protein
MGKRAYFVLGPENSGTRFFRRCLCSAGCYGDPDAGESTDDLCFRDKPSKLALARSVPNGLLVPDVLAIAGLLKAAGYRVTPILISRRSDFVVAGQLKNYEGRTFEAARQTILVAAKLAYELASWLKTTLVVVPYGLFVTVPEVRGHLFAQLGLPPPTVEVVNANEKYGLAGLLLPF